MQGSSQILWMHHKGGWITIFHPYLLSTQINLKKLPILFYLLDTVQVLLQNGNECLILPQRALFHSKIEHVHGCVSEVIDHQRGCIHLADTLGALLFLAPLGISHVTQLILCLSAMKTNIFHFLKQNKVTSLRNLPFKINAILCSIHKPRSITDISNLDLLFSG